MRDGRIHEKEARARGCREGPKEAEEDGRRRLVPRPQAGRFEKEEQEGQQEAQEQGSHRWPTLRQALVCPFSRECCFDR